ncbi:hypothetical protein ACFYXP_39675 [Streptomyces sp. NPDC002466]|uniref:hypothetical protein n=1 Tax=Streptomyces sp. NPDC002466 TaxID=3364646 RepID=UPI0036A65961
MSWLSFLDARARAGHAAQVLKGVPAFARSRLRAADVWVQDHHVGVGATVLMVICTAVGLLLRFRMDQVVELARQFAPVCTIFAAVISAVLGLLKWIRKRKKARLAAMEAARS